MSTDRVSVAATIQQRKPKNACEVIDINDEIGFMKAKAWLRFCGQWTITCLSSDAPRGLTKPLPWRQQDFQIQPHSLVFFHPWMKTLVAKKEKLLEEINHRKD